MSGHQPKGYNPPRGGKYPPKGGPSGTPPPLPVTVSITLTPGANPTPEQLEAFGAMATAIVDMIVTGKITKDGVQGK